MLKRQPHGCLVHDFDCVVSDRLLKAQPLKALGVFVLFRIFVIDAVYLRGLQHGIALQLQGQADSRGVSSQIRPADTAADDDNPTFFEVADRPTVRKRVSNLFGPYIGDNPRRHLMGIKDVRQRQGVHHRCQHTDIVRRYAADAVSC